MTASSGMERKTGDFRIYIVSILLLSCVIVGGTFLVMYILHPESESESNSWYPTVGIVLVGIPWIFWILTFFYAWLKRIVASSPPKNTTTTTTTTADNNNKVAPENANARTSGATSTSSTSIDSPGGGGGGGVGHVRFGAAMVMGEGDDKDGKTDSYNGDAHSDIDQESMDGALHINGGTHGDFSS